MNRILAKLFALLFLVGFSMKLYGAPVVHKANPVEAKSHKTEQVQNHDGDCDDGDCGDCDCGCDDCDCGDGSCGGCDDCDDCDCHDSKK